MLVPGFFVSFASLAVNAFEVGFQFKNSRGSVMTPVTAEAATVAAEPM